jgi:biotin transport system substrate-specific component
MRIRDITFMAVFVALMAVCSWLEIPSVVPFTMQTFAVFFAVEMLGGKRGVITVLAYILLGAVGVPVFSGFSGGLGAIMGPTGGYIIGFLASAAIMWLLERFIKGSGWKAALRMLAGLIACYVFGTAWFMRVYAANSGPVALATALSWCVVPFILPDCAKIALAALLSARLKKHITI